MTTPVTADRPLTVRAVYRWNHFNCGFYLCLACSDWRFDGTPIIGQTPAAVVAEINGRRATLGLSPLVLAAA